MTKRSKKTKKRSNNKTDAQEIHGSGIAGAISTNSSGLFTLATYDIDTDLFTSWANLAESFEQWRIKHITFIWIPNCITNQNGTIGLACTDDPDESSPTSLTEFTTLRVSNLGVSWARFSIHYKPLMKKWLYTKDAVTSDDRFEMPGVLLIASEGFGSAQSPGRVLAKYTIEMRGMINPALHSFKNNKNIQMPLSREIKQKNKKIKGEETKLSTTTAENENTDNKNEKGEILNKIRSGATLTISEVTKLLEKVRVIDND